MIIIGSLELIALLESEFLQPYRGLPSSTFSRGAMRRLEQGKAIRGLSGRLKPALKRKEATTCLAC